MRESALQIAAVVLAAGGSRRFGGPKLLSTVPGRMVKPILIATLEAVLSADLAQTIVVLGCDAPSLQPLLERQPVEIVFNRRWCEGMSSSLRAGLAAVSADIEAVLFVLADQPRLSPTIIHQIVEAYRQTGSEIVIPVYEGRRGNPRLFDRRTFEQLHQVAGDEGGRSLIGSGRFSVHEVEVGDPAVIDDIDQPEDLVALWADDDTAGEAGP